MQNGGVSIMRHSNPSYDEYGGKNTMHQFSLVRQFQLITEFLLIGPFVPGYWIFDNATGGPKWQS